MVKIMPMTRSGQKKVHMSIEATAAALLLVVMTALTLLLISSTGSSYRSITASGASSQSLRTGLMFVTTKVRQADSGECVSVRGGPAGGSAVVITHAYGDGIYENWIFYYKGALREATVKQGEKINPDACEAVAALSEFTASQSGRTITASAGSAQQGSVLQGSARVLSRTVTLTLR